MNQLAFPCPVTPEEVARERTFGGAIELCAKAAGLAPKQLQDAAGCDRAQYSRWKDDKEGILWPKLVKLMDICGNDAPLLWMLLNRGFDLSSLRRQESELERELREAREWIALLEAERRAERNLLSEVLGRPVMVQPSRMVPA